MTTFARIGFVITAALVGFIGGAFVGALFDIAFIGACAGAGYSIGWAITTSLAQPETC